MYKRWRTAIDSCRATASTMMPAMTAELVKILLLELFRSHWEGFTSSDTGDLVAHTNVTSHRTGSMRELAVVGFNPQMQMQDLKTKTV